MREVILALVGVLLISAAGSESARAYLDPGTGSMLLQGLIAAIVGASVVLRAYWTKIKGFLGGIFAPRKQGSMPADSGDD